MPAAAASVGAVLKLVSAGRVCGSGTSLERRLGF